MTRISVQLGERVSKKRESESKNGKLGERQNTGKNKRRQAENQLKESYSDYDGHQQAGKMAQLKQETH